MKNLLLFTVDEQQVAAFVQHIEQEFGYTPERFTDIDWTGVVPKDNTTTTFTLHDDTDVAAYLKQNKIRSLYLDGNRYIHVFTSSPTIDDYLPAVNKLLNDKATSYGYDDIVSACSYATSTNDKYRQEGTAFVAWRDAVWADFYAKIDQAQQSGNWPDPQVLLDSLPAFTV